MATSVKEKILHDKPILMESTWLTVLKEEFDKPYMKSLEQFILKEIRQEKVLYPPRSEIFNAFCYTPFSEVKVVIVGQDPYHGPSQAHGLSFSVPKGQPIPPSLQNIFQEIRRDLGIDQFNSGSLIHWAQQGVLLLNATLTVEAQKPGSHYGKGWELFTDVVIEKLSKRKDPLVFLLWGKYAQEKCKSVLHDENSPHLVLTAAHPSPYSAKNFFGCCHFSKTNQFLTRHGKKPVDWKIP